LLVDFFILVAGVKDLSLCSNGFGPQQMFLSFLRVFVEERCICKPLCCIYNPACSVEGLQARLSVGVSVPFKKAISKLETLMAL